MNSEIQSMKKQRYKRTRTNKHWTSFPTKIMSMSRKFVDDQYFLLNQKATKCRNNLVRKYNDCNKFLRNLENHDCNMILVKTNYKVFDKGINKRLKNYPKIECARVCVLFFYRRSILEGFDTSSLNSTHNFKVGRKSQIEWFFSRGIRREQTRDNSCAL